MKIGIIGAGNIGATLTRRLTSLGHEVKVANSRGPETLTDLAVETGATAVPVVQTVPGSDIVVVTIPEKSVPELPAGLFDDAREDVVVIDTGNYYPQRDGQIAEIDSGTPSSRWVAAQLGRTVVKAFNNIQVAASPGARPGPRDARAHRPAGGRRRRRCQGARARPGRGARLRRRRCRWPRRLLAPGAGHARLRRRPRRGRVAPSPRRGHPVDGRSHVSAERTDGPQARRRGAVLRSGARGGYGVTFTSRTPVVQSLWTGPPISPAAHTFWFGVAPDGSSATAK